MLWRVAALNASVVGVFLNNEIYIMIVKKIDHHDYEEYVVRTSQLFS